MSNETSSQQTHEVVELEEQDSPRVVLMLFLISLVSTVVWFLLGRFSSNDDLLPVCGLLIITALASFGAALLRPFYLMSERKIVPVILTVLYTVAAVAVGIFAFAMSGWALYSNGL